ncbi:TPA: hypothetical protein ACX3HX_004442 [Raoultella ornithinolytica]
MTTDITELAQSLKAAAINAKELAIIARYSKGRAAAEKFYALANPNNVIALVEALEKAQAKATQQGNIACALLDEVTQLRRHADEKAPELRAQLIEADSELEALRQRIAELESFHTAYMAWSDKTDWVRTDRRFDVVKPLGKHLADVLKAYIEHLESRTVTVKLPELIVDKVCLTAAEIHAQGSGVNDDKAQEIIDRIREILTPAAGIKWEVE